MQEFHSGELDKQLEVLTKEHGTGTYWNKDGVEIKLRQHVFEDFLVRKMILGAPLAACNNPQQLYIRVLLTMHRATTCIKCEA